jgi:hypothetical protein
MPTMLLISRIHCAIRISWASLVKAREPYRRMAEAQPTNTPVDPKKVRRLVGHGNCPNHIILKAKPIELYTELVGSLAIIVSPTTLRDCTEQLSPTKSEGMPSDKSCMDGCQIDLP